MKSVSSMVSIDMLHVVVFFGREGTALNDYIYSNQRQSGDRWKGLFKAKSFSASN